MKLIESNVMEIVQEPGIQGIYQQIEKCGRTCYKSENAISPGTAEKFVERMISNKHYAMLEHGTVYLRVPVTTLHDEAQELQKVLASKYSYNYAEENLNIYVTSNLRVLVENAPNSWREILNAYALDEPDEAHLRRVTCKWIISIGIANEFIRHREFSFAQESTRYCNYSKDKFGNGLTFIIPEWYKQENTKDILEAKNVWHYHLVQDEVDYLNLIELGLKPQDARGILPKDLKTELVMTGTMVQWVEFFDKRVKELTGKVHPDAKFIVSKWYDICFWS